jgi:ferrochelatase
VLLVNLGSPAAPTTRDVRRYLREFLMDERVLDAPWPLRFCIVHLAILPFRAKRSAAAYRAVWLAEGSPLIVAGLKVQAQLQRRLPVPVELAMRYQEPSIPGALARLARQGASELLVIPLFPHYAMSSYESAAARAQEAAARQAPRLKLEILPPFYDEPDYIAALAGRAAPFLEAGYDHLLLSFHGLPERHLRKADPTGAHCLVVEDCCHVDSPAHRTCYRAQCFKTVAAFVRRAGVPEGKYSVGFQSGLGRRAWLQPHTGHQLASLASSGTKRLLVICPAFVADCLETLEEIGIRGRALFRAAGGGELALIPCLNDHPLWLEALERWVRRWLSAGS